MPLRIAIDARLIGGASGGVEQFVCGLVRGLSELADGDDYVILAYSDETAWIEPFIGGGCRLLRVGPAPRESARQRIKRLPLIRDVWKGIGPVLEPVLAGGTVRVPRSDGTIEREKVDLIHFPKQTGFLTDVPSIFHPWDLQHLHYPEFFSRGEWRIRDAQYRAFCERARIVFAPSEWCRRDFIARYGLPEGKVRILPFGNPLRLYPTPTDAEVAAVRRKFELPERFLYYPAQTWRHKNHVALLEALARVRDREGVTIPLVSSGRRTESFAEIRTTVERLGLDGQARFLGFLPAAEVTCLYRLAQGLVFPSKFEGWGLPVTEAFSVGLPVACANVTSLPEVTGDAALLFDPDDVEEIAGCIGRLWSDEAVRAELIRRGRDRADRVTWRETAERCRDVYRELCVSRP